MNRPENFAVAQSVKNAVEVAGTELLPDSTLLLVSAMGATVFESLKDACEDEDGVGVVTIGVLLAFLASRKMWESHFRKVVVIGLVVRGLHHTSPHLPLLDLAMVIISELENSRKKREKCHSLRM